MVTIQFQIVFKFQFQMVAFKTKAKTATKAKAQTKPQVFAINDKSCKDNDKAYDADIPQKSAR